MKNTHKQYLYNEVEGVRLFEEGELIPEGWYDSPDFENAIPMFDIDDYVTENMRKDAAPTIEEIEDKVKESFEEAPKKYLSQMNLSELKEEAKLLGIEGFDETITKRDLRKLIEKKQDDNSSTNN